MIPGRSPASHFPPGAACGRTRTPTSVLPRRGTIPQTDSRTRFSDSQEGRAVLTQTPFSDPRTPSGSAVLPAPIIPSLQGRLTRPQCGPCRSHSAAPSARPSVSTQKVTGPAGLSRAGTQGWVRTAAAAWLCRPPGHGWGARSGPWLGGSVSARAPLHTAAERPGTAPSPGAGRGAGVPRSTDCWIRHCQAPGQHRPVRAGDRKSQPWARVPRSPQRQHSNTARLLIFYFLRLFLVIYVYIPRCLRLLKGIHSEAES